MNRENILYMKQIMEQAEALDMESYQDCPRASYHPEDEDEFYATSIEELHECGNTACFAGYMALSEKFKQGTPEYETGKGSCEFLGPEMYPRGLKGKFEIVEAGLAGEVLYGDDAVSLWLGISSTLAANIVHGSDDFYKKLFGVRFQDVQPSHLVKVMNMVLDGELT